MTAPLLQVEILKDTASPAVNDLLSALKNPEPVMKQGATAAARTLQDWFRTRNGERNKRGWPARGLWAEIAGATAVQSVSGTEAVIAIAHPAIAQKVYGGEITPKRGRFLALPAIAEAYAAGSPREGATPDLKFMKAYNPEIGRWMWCLFAPEAGTKRVKDRRKGHAGEYKTIEDKRKPGGKVWYWLARRVNQAADPRALPGMDLLGAAARAAMLDYLGTRTGARSQL